MAGRARSGQLGTDRRAWGAVVVSHGRNEGVLNRIRETQLPTVRPARDADAARVVELFERAFSRPMSQAHWHWKLARRHAPCDNVWLAIDEDDVPIFQYAGIPIRLRVDEREVEAMVGVDTMADPQRRRRGLLTRVGRHTYDTWRQAGVAAVLGLPNEQWGSRTRALGWEPLFEFGWRLRPLAPEVLLARRLRLPWPRGWRLAGRLIDLLVGRPPEAGLTVRELATASPEIDQLWQRPRDEHRFSVVRDAARLAWRYLESPDGAYRLLLSERDSRPVAYAALRCQTTTGGRLLGWIAEVHATRDEPNAMALLIDRAVRQLSSDGAELVGALAQPGSTFDRALHRAGFWFRPGRFSFELLPLADDLPLADMRRSENWNLAGGDFDVI